MTGFSGDKGKEKLSDYWTAVGILCGLVDELGAQGSVGIAVIRLSKSHGNLYIV
ncbi:hypothetical protein Scep_012139 [Stephania cephalantha]|uniref:Uncharacterized protein n=1 Tax=Stephania cephalantha TaxID=152367 RepID=A0AAP0P9K9_9MAGN